MAFASELFTIATGVIALWVVVSSMPWSARQIVTFRLTLAKLVTVGPALRSGLLAAGRSRRSWLSMWRVVSRRVARRIAGHRIDVADELDWVSATLDLPYGVTFHGGDSAGLDELAAAYQTLAARLSVRVLLAGGDQPLIEAEARCAKDVAARLARHARREAVPAEVPSWTGKAGGAAQPTEIALFGIGPFGPHEAHDLLVSARRIRLVPDLPAAVERARHDGARPVVVPLGEQQAVVVDELARQAHGYDGILPALLAHRSEKDRRSGHRRLHLSLGEISYSAHKIVSAPDYVPSQRGLEPAAPSAPLTLSLIPVTADGFLVLARRSATNVFYSNAWGPGVNGNLDVPDRHGEGGDGDDDGLPDPVGALIREAREELGLTVDRRHVRVHGLARIVNATERGTWILLTTARVRASLDELRGQTVYADPIEGSWEVGSDLLAIPRPRTSQAAADVLAWAWSSAEVAPHAVAVLTGHCAADGLIPDDGWSWRRDGDGDGDAAADRALPAGATVLEFG